MSSEPREDELYEDLSILLVMIRKIFKNMLLRDSQDEVSKNRDAVNEEAVINSRCSQLTIKYKKASIRKIEFVHIINRFMCRVKEILKQIILCIPKEKIQIVIILKKMELLAIKVITIDNSASVILSLLEIIGNCNVKLIHSTHSLKIRPNSPLKEQKAPTERPIEKQLSFKEDFNKQKVKKVQITQSELNVMTKNLEKYSVMGLDKQFFRGRYFDLKTEQNSSIFQQAMLRNRNIKNLMSRFEKDYTRHVVKSNSNTISLKDGEKNSKKRTICWQITPVQQQSSNLLSAKREFSSRSANSHRIPLNKSNQILPTNPLQMSAEMSIETYRSMYESKMIKSRAKKTIKMNNTIIDVPSVVANPNATIINMKRWNFFKKSTNIPKTKAITRLRYKIKINTGMQTPNYSIQQAVDFYTNLITHPSKQKKPQLVGYIQQC